ncbi:hypothetical protein [Streptomyces sp. NPDC048436]|uniref:hypothetical protein n=1 Tax=Streptomyces sp. NPDC048436 TaxID=3365550 RepID=UPI00371C1A34
MIAIAVTGHMDLTEASVPLVRRALREALTPYRREGITGLSCVAGGADSLFAEAVLALGGRLVAVIPSRDYRERRVGAGHAETFDRLVEAADEVIVLDHAGAGADGQAYEDANRVLLRRADRLFAVWDGRSSTAPPGGTAAAVADARRAGLPVDVVWPDGAKRENAGGAAGR